VYRDALHALGDRRAQAAHVPECATAADERHTQAALEPFSAGDGNHADDAGARDVRAAARRQVAIRDLDDAQRARALRFLAQRQRGRLGVADVADGDGPVIPDHLVRPALGRRNGLGSDLAIEVDRRGLGTQVETHGARAVQRLECGRQHVLPRVLLHVIEASIAIDGPVHRAARLERAIDDVQHFTGRFIVDDVDNAHAAERAGIERLPS